MMVRLWLLLWSGLAVLGLSSTASFLLSEQSRSSPGEDRVLGTWILNVEKSSYKPGPPPRSQKRIYEAHGDGVKATIVTVDAEGKSVTAQYTANYDSLEYPLTGSEQIDAIALKKVNATTAEATLMHARKIIGTARRVLSEDGKTMTITFQGTDPEGRSVLNVAFYEKKDNP